VNPIRDKETIDIELQLKDLETVEKRIAKVEKMAKTGGDKDAKATFEVLTKIRAELLKGISIRGIDLDDNEKERIEDIGFITAKPVLYLCNVDEASAKEGNKFVDQVREAVKNENAEVLHIAVAIESEIAQLETYEEKMMFLEELGLDEPGVNKLIKKVFSLLNLQTYFTAGVKEVRAWTITKGMTAPEAAGVIHSDFQKGFIRAEVIKFKDYIQLKSESACRDNGKLSVEGKEYIVQDGDVMHFRFNV
jgi:GTP-binding protein YchF